MLAFWIIWPSQAFVKKAHVEDKASLQKDIVAQEYLGSKERTQGPICHSASPAHVGQFISPIRLPTVKDYKSPYKERLAESRVGAARLYRKRHESEPGDVDTPSRNTSNRLREPLSEDPIQARGISHNFEVTCRRLRSLVKNDEKPPVLEERWSFQGFRDMYEARRPKCGLEPLVSTTNFGFVPNRAQARVETPLNSHIAIKSPFNRDIGSLRGKIEYLDTQRAGEVDFFEFEVLMMVVWMEDAGRSVKSNLWLLGQMK